MYNGRVCVFVCEHMCKQPTVSINTKVLNTEHNNLRQLNQCTNLMHQFLYYLHKLLLQSSTCLGQSCLSSGGEILLTQRLVSSLSVGGLMVHRLVEFSPNRKATYRE
jgi:hypothetical protein